MTSSITSGMTSGMTPDRWLFAFVAAACFGLLAYALYTEHFEGLVPCALCMTQRAFYLAAGLSAVLALLVRPGVTGTRAFGIATGVFAAAGAGFAGRQVWLQSLPEDQAPACGPSLEYMLETLPFTETLQTLMMGDGNCAEVVWTFLGMSMPTWSLIWLIALALCGFAAAAIAGVKR